MKRCGIKRKVKFVDQAQALSSVHSNRRMRAYYCAPCGYWHLTKQLAPELRLIRGRDLPPAKEGRPP